ncbi:phage tail sheath subtilisin-like domain-containing protein [Candidatus Pacearchaeota archaeon]|nr:phage tail sheath subtilisin-like domain-containing protein [Candidatus Pacearchaeota archaeon]
MASAKDFKFISPGVYTAEVDNSQLPKTAAQIGPVIIGRSERGPGLRPVQVSSFAEYLEIFGNPIPGNSGDDVWRDGNYLAPTYGVYAAQAWLKNSTPLTYVRLLGAQNTDAVAAGYAGWTTSGSFSTSNTTNGGAYGLFIVDSGSAGVTDMGDGVLAAVWYLNEGSIRLSGTTIDGVVTTNAATWVKSTGADYQFKAIIDGNDSGMTALTATFNFSKSSRNYIREIFNTNPTLINSTITDSANLQSYWLGETYDQYLYNKLTETTGAGYQYGCILALGNSTKSKQVHTFGMQESKTGWIISQDLGDYSVYSKTAMSKLFRFHSINKGEWDQKNIKISIQDVKASTNSANPYGTFAVVIRKASDKDSSVILLEKFSGCNLDPKSPNYIAKQIGDKYVSWSDTTRRYTEYGNYDNKSKYVYVEMNEDVDAGSLNKTYLPFGFYGPPRYKYIVCLSGSALKDSDDSTTLVFTKGSGSIPYPYTTPEGSGGTHTGLVGFTADLYFPCPILRTYSNEDNLPSNKLSYWGVTTKQYGSTAYDESYADIVRCLADSVDSYDASDTSGTETSFIFSLDDIKYKASSAIVGEYSDGCRLTGDSITASGTYESVLTAGFDRFTMPLFGGHDGLDIREKEPFRNSGLSGGTETTNYAFNSVKRAVDSVSDAEVVEMNLIAMPGITNTTLTQHMLDVASDRGDTLAVFDLVGDYTPQEESTDAESSRLGSVDTTISNLRARSINNSYGCCFYPWVRIQDTVSDASLWVPPSVAAIGVMASSEKNSELWFAPAGFNRGGLSTGAAGLPVINVREKLTSSDREKLYAANINPIASFPREGIVVWGQKTLQVTASALDRINVRRLMIYLKKEISRMALNILFDQNVRITWNSFLGKAEPFLASVKTRLGLYEYKLILDETTTTPELIDRNAVYAKIFVKPAKSIERFYIDFVITDTGASFND